MIPLADLQGVQLSSPSFWIPFIIVIILAVAFGAYLKRNGR